MGHHLCQVLTRPTQEQLALLRVAPVEVQKDPC